MMNPPLFLAKSQEFAKQKPSNAMQQQGDFQHDAPINQQSKKNFEHNGEFHKLIASSRYLQKPNEQI